MAVKSLSNAQPYFICIPPTSGRLPSSLTTAPTYAQKVTAAGEAMTYSVDNTPNAGRGLRAGVLRQLGPSVSVDGLRPQ